MYVVCSDRCEEVVPYIMYTLHHHHLAEPLQGLSLHPPSPPHLQTVPITDTSTTTQTKAQDNIHVEQTHGQVISHFVVLFYTLLDTVHACIINYVPQSNSDILTTKLRIYLYILASTMCSHACHD